MVFSAIRSSAPEVARFSLFREGKESQQFNTTSHLICMADAAEKGDLCEALRWLEAAKNFTLFALEKISDEALRGEMAQIVTRECLGMEAYLEEAATKVHPLAREAVFFSQGTDQMFASNVNGQKYISFTGFGEDLAEKLYVHYFTRKGIKNTALDAGQISGDVFGQKPREAIEQRGQIVEFVKEFVRQRIQDAMDREPQGVLISGGRLPGAAESRGYSDVAAVLLAKAKKWKKEDPLTWIVKRGSIESANPDLVKSGRRTVKRLSQDTSIEVFDQNGAEAAALHTDAAKMLEKGMQVVVGSPLKREELTWISADHSFDDESAVQTVAFKVVPDVLLVSGGDMVQRPAVLKVIMQRFEDISVGHVHTDGGKVLVTFNQAPVEGLAAELQDYLVRLYDRGYTVKFIGKQAWVFCIGNALDNDQKSAVFRVMGEQKVRALRELGSPQVFKVLVHQDYAPALTEALHAEFFPEPARVEA